MTDPATDAIRYSIVLPVFNEQAILPMLLRRLDTLMAELDGPAETIFVDDGSDDCSPIVLAARARDNPAYRYIRLSRNFGHQIAISAGIDAARGGAVVVMDSDLQDPPEVVHEMIGKWREGFDVVYARRASRTGESRFKRATAALFYRLVDRLSVVKIPRDVGDFRLIDRKVVDAFKRMPEQDRYVRGMFAWLGFTQTEVTYHRAGRAAGTTKYPLAKMIRLAVSGIVSFSDLPLRLAIWAGLGVSMLAGAYGVYAIVVNMIGERVVEGWTSTVVIVSFLCGANMMMTGIVGLYVGRIHAEVKRRPLYVIDQQAGFERAVGLDLLEAAPRAEADAQSRHLPEAS
ncbi:MAG TPA: glycosyltransferase family 2 protein [Xanthobacteraceae bacterium]|jgi:glycosyltransferase involved in cell wall biosynthesis|nr:glycosyltransferase family 2 protein [Xanthobacteraceae bacterium]